MQVANHPLVVDLDGTLINTDMLHELAIKMFWGNPFCVVMFPFKLIKGKAHLKHYITSQTEINVESLPYNSDLVDWLRIQKLEENRHLVLCTASDIDIAKPIAAYIGIFDEVMASDGELNLSGENKARALVERFGEGKFDYCGNASIDLQVWKYVRNAIVVNASKQLMDKANDISHVSQVFGSPTKPLKPVIDALHTYRWVINLVIFIPLVVIQTYFDSDNTALLAYCSLLLYLLACNVPIIRDLFLIEKDRCDSTKNNNPFASGDIPIHLGVIAIFISSLCIVVSTLKMML